MKVVPEAGLQEKKKKQNKGGSTKQTYQTDTSYTSIHHLKCPNYS